MKATKVQEEIIKWKDGNLLVTAAAGSGKTFVFTNRIAYLIAKHGVDPSKILALTFTKNAAEQMRDRLAKIVGKDIAKEVHMSTFHSFAYGQLRRHFPYKYNNRPIMADWFKTRMLYDIVGEKKQNNPHGHGLNMSATELANFVSYQKSHMIRDNDAVIIDEKTPYCRGDNRSSLQSAYDTYLRLSRNSKSIEFDDMIMELAIEISENAEFKQKMIDQFDYVLVDEFQDTSYSNSYILKQINKDNLMVVGDPNQSIFSFINADIEMIVEFENEFDNVSVKRLDSNYRSNNNVVKASNRIVMASEVDSYKKYAEQVPARQDLDNNDVVFTTYSSENDEVVSVCGNIQDLIESNPDLPLTDIAVISRTNASLGLFESEFADLKIPVHTSGGRSFFDKKEVADLLSYAQHAIDPSDDMSLRRVFNAPNRFISKQILSDLDEFAYNEGIPLSEAIEKYDGFGRTTSSVLKMNRMFGRLRENLNQNASAFLKSIYTQTNYEEFMTKNAKTMVDLNLKKESIEKLFGLAKKFKSIESFLVHVSIVKNNNNKTKNAVQLMTVHAAKGLEFGHVYGVGINEDSYPHDMSYNYEEERRLLYVLVSRAIDNLKLSSYVFKGSSTAVGASPFIVDAFGDVIVESRKKVLYGSDMDEIELAV